MRHLLAQMITKDDLNLPQKTVENSTFTTVLQIVFGIAGGIALIVIILAGLKYVTSQGDPAGVAKAKNSIIYAVIGLVVATLAFTIVTFVVRSV